MKNTVCHIHSHLKRIHHHIKQHHKKYLFGMFGGFAVAKLFLLVLSLSVVQYTTSIFAEGETGCVLTGQIYTGEYQTGEYLTGQEFTGGYLTGCITIPGYRTGGALDESGVLTGQTRVEEFQTGCIFTGQEFTGGYRTGEYLTGGYRTGGYLTGCIQQTGSTQTGNTQTGSTQTGNTQTGNTQTGNTQTGTLSLGNGVCESGDIIWSAPLSGSVVRDIFPLTWAYSGTDCLSGLSLQLWDHNSQRIDLGSLASGTTTSAFDSKRLYSFQQSGFYHIIGTGTVTTGIFYLYTGTYTGAYSRLFTGYAVRLLSHQTPISATSPFTIDNQYPTLTGISLFSSGSVTGYLNVSGVVRLAFIASEELSGLQVTLGSGKVATNSTVSGLYYTYTRNLTSLYTEGVLAATIAFADKAGNTGSLIYTSSLVFDKTRPVVTGFVFTEYSGGLYLNFSGSEAVRYTLTYQKTGGSLMSGSNAEYLTAQQVIFSGIERDKLYTFTLSVFDRSENSRTITGDVLRTNLGVITSHFYLVPVTADAVLTGSLSTLAVVLKAEVAKFNACKNALSYTPVELEVRHTAFILQMPTFKKSQVKTLVNAFTLFVLDKVKHNYKITSTEVDEITKKFDNFLIILKLLRDDDNDCKQNLSNYHISQFKKILEEYNISLE